MKKYLIIFLCLILMLIPVSATPKNQKDADKTIIVEKNHNKDSGGSDTARVVTIQQGTEIGYKITSNSTGQQWNCIETDKVPWHGLAPNSGDIEDQIRKNDVSQELIDAFKAERGIVSTGPNGKGWKLPDGREITSVDLKDFAALAAKLSIPFNPSDYYPEHTYTSSTRTEEVSLGANKTALVSVIEKGYYLFLNYENEDREFYQGKENKIAINRTLFGNTTNLSSLYEGSTPNFSKNFNEEIFKKAAKIDTSYTATWYNIKKYRIDYYTDYYIDGNFDHSEFSHSEGPFYSVVGTPTKTIPIKYLPTLYYPEYTLLKPIDLTTGGIANQSLTRKTKYVEYKDPTSTSGGMVDASIVDKSGVKSGEIFSVLSNNTPVKFTVDFGNSWYGVPDSYKLYGRLSPDDVLALGENFVREVTFVYGADKEQEDRTTKINSLTPVGETENDETTTITQVINSGASGSNDFYIRNIQENVEGEHYELGEDGNNYWLDIVEIARLNFGGCYWYINVAGNSASANGDISDKDFTRYLIYDYFEQPVLYGEYDSLTAAGR